MAYSGERMGGDHSPETDSDALILTKEWVLDAVHAYADRLGAGKRIADGVADLTSDYYDDHAESAIEAVGVELPLTLTNLYIVQERIGEVPFEESDALTAATNDVGKIYCPIQSQKSREGQDWEFEDRLLYMRHPKFSYELALAVGLPSPYPVVGGGHHERQIYGGYGLADPNKTPREDTVLSALRVADFTSAIFRRPTKHHSKEYDRYGKDLEIRRTVNLNYPISTYGVEAGEIADDVTDAMASLMHGEMPTRDVARLAVIRAFNVADEIGFPHIGQSIVKL